MRGTAWQRQQRMKHPRSGSEVVTPRHDFDRSASDENCVLHLRSKRAANIAEGRIRHHDAFLDELLQSKKMVGLSQGVQPAPTKRERPEILKDR